MAPDIYEAASALLHHHHLSRQISHLKSRLEQLDKAFQAHKTRAVAPPAPNAPTARDVERLREDVNEAIDREFEIRAVAARLERQVEGVEGVVRAVEAGLTGVGDVVEQGKRAWMEGLRDLERQWNQYALGVEQRFAGMGGRLDGLLRERVGERAAVGAVQLQMERMREENGELRGLIAELSRKLEAQEVSAAQPDISGTVIDSVSAVPPVTPHRIAPDAASEAPKPLGRGQRTYGAVSKPRKRARQSQNWSAVKRRRVVPKQPAQSQKVESSQSTPLIQQSLADESTAPLEAQEDSEQPLKLEAPETLILRGRQVAKPYLLKQQARTRQSVTKASKAKKEVEEALQIADAEKTPVATTAESSTVQERARATGAECPPSKVVPPAKDDEEEKAVSESANARLFGFNLIRRANRVHGRTVHQQSVVSRAPDQVHSLSDTESNASAREL